MNTSDPEPQSASNSEPIATERTEVQNFKVSAEPPPDILDVVIDASTIISGSPSDLADSVIRKVSLHFQGIGYGTLNSGKLKAELFVQLSQLLGEQPVSPRSIKDDVKQSLKEYFSEEDRRVTKRWRARIGVVADSLTLISVTQTLAGFALGVLEQKMTAGPAVLSDRDDHTAGPWPWPIQNLAWNGNPKPIPGWTWGAAELVVKLVPRPAGRYCYFQSLRCARHDAQALDSAAIYIEPWLIDDGNRPQERAGVVWPTGPVYRYMSYMSDDVRLRRHFGSAFNGAVYPFMADELRRLGSPFTGTLSFEIHRDTSAFRHKPIELLIETTKVQLNLELPF